MNVDPCTIEAIPEATLAEWSSVPTAEIVECLVDCERQVASPNSDTHEAMARQDVLLYSAILAAREVA